MKKIKMVLIYSFILIFCGMNLNAMTEYEKLHTRIKEFVDSQPENVQINRQDEYTQENPFDTNPDNKLFWCLCPNAQEFMRTRFMAKLILKIKEKYPNREEVISLIDIASGGLAQTYLTVLFLIKEEGYKNFNLFLIDKFYKPKLVITEIITEEPSPDTFEQRDLFNELYRITYETQTAHTVAYQHHQYKIQNPNVFFIKEKPRDTKIIRDFKSLLEQVKSDYDVEVSTFVRSEDLSRLSSKLILMFYQIKSKTRNTNAIITMVDYNDVDFLDVIFEKLKTELESQHTEIITGRMGLRGVIRGNIVETDTAQNQ